MSHRRTFRFAHLCRRHLREESAGVEELLLLSDLDDLATAARSEVEQIIGHFRLKGEHANNIDHCGACVEHLCQGDNNRVVELQTVGVHVEISQKLTPS